MSLWEKDKNTEGRITATVSTSAAYPAVLESSVFVDKTEMIATLFAKDSHKNNILSAPSQWGKSTIVSMLKHFLEIEIDDGGEPISTVNMSTMPVNDTPNYCLFTDCELKITKNKPIMDEHFGKYPVLHVDMNDTTYFSHKTAATAVRTTIRQAYCDHSYLLHSQKLSDKDKMKIQSRMCGKRRFKFPEMYDLVTLAQYLHKHFDKECIVLVDNYDRLLMNWCLPGALTSDHFEPLLVSVLFPLLHDKKIARVVMFGAFHFAGNLPEFEGAKKNPFLHDHPFNTCFGLTEDEARLLIYKHGGNEEYWERWLEFFGGYNLENGQQLYNMIFMMNQLALKYTEHEYPISSFMIEMLRVMPPDHLNLFVRMKRLDNTSLYNLKQMIQSLRRNGGILIDIYDDVFHALLCDVGYLVVVKRDQKTCWLMHPNGDEADNLSHNLMIYSNVPLTSDNSDAEE